MERASFSRAHFLRGIDKLEEYKARIGKDFHSGRARGNLDIYTCGIGGTIFGSNPFANVRIASSGLALPSEVMHVFELSPSLFSGDYIDLALVLRTNGDSIKVMDYNARHLFEQVRHRGYIPSKEFPVMIPLGRGLIIKEDDNSPYGLVHILTDEAQIIQDHRLRYKNRHKKFSITDENGIPIFDNRGTMEFHAKKNGLDRFGLYGLMMGLGSLFCMSYRPESYLEEYFPFPPFPFHFRIREGYFENLSISHEIGRVAVVENLSSGK